MIARASDPLQKKRQSRSALGNAGIDFTQCQPGSAEALSQAFTASSQSSSARAVVDPKENKENNKAKTVKRIVMFPTNEWH